MARAQSERRQSESRLKKLEKQAGEKGDLEAAGGMIAFETTVSGLSVHAAADERVCVHTAAMDLTARTVVNSAGLSAPQLAHTVCESGPGAYYARGHYYALSGSAPKWTLRSLGARPRSRARAR